MAVDVGRLGDGLRHAGALAAPGAGRIPRLQELGGVEGVRASARGGPGDRPGEVRPGGDHQGGARGDKTQPLSTFRHGVRARETREVLNEYGPKMI